MERKKIGLALGGGAARGLAHIGVLEVLEREGIPIDLITGTSAGALVGAFYAQGKDAALIKQMVLQFSWRKLAPLVDPSLPTRGLIKGKKVKDLIELFIGGDTKFSDLKIPLACVATDINTGEEVVIDRGSVTEALRASISIPGLFVIVHHEGRHLVDGQLVNPVPVSVARRMGADFVIAVNVIPDVTGRAHGLRKEHAGVLKEPNLISIIMQSIYIGTYAMVKVSVKKADVVIEPKVAHVGAGEFHRGKELIEAGEIAAAELLYEIRLKLGGYEVKR